MATGAGWAGTEPSSHSTKPWAKEDLKNGNAGWDQEHTGTAPGRPATTCQDALIDYSFFIWKLDVRILAPFLV